jgi:cobalamin biosynthesis protein CobT
MSIDGKLAMHFEEALSSTIRVLAQNYGVNVEFIGDHQQAGTNGDRVILPKLPDGTIISNDDADIISGFGMHEMGHVIMTDFKHAETWAKRVDELAKYTANALEDVRLERAMTTILPGTKAKMEETVDYTCKHAIEAIEKEGPDGWKDFRSVGPVAITWMGRKRLGYDTPHLNECISRLAPEAKKKVDAWLDQLWPIETGIKGLATINRDKALQGSRDVMTLAETISKKMQDEPDASGAGSPETACKPGGKGGTGTTAGKGPKSDGHDPDAPADEEMEQETGTDEALGKGDEDEGEAEGSAAGEDEDEPDAEDEDEGDWEDEDDVDPDDDFTELGGTVQESSAVKKDESEGRMSGGGAGSGGARLNSGSPKPIDPNLGAAVMNLMKQIVKQEDEIFRAYRPFTRAWDCWHTQHQTQPSVKGGSKGFQVLKERANGKLYQNVITEITGVLSVMKRKMERAIMSIGRADYEGGKRNGRLDSTRLDQVPLGQPKVFRERIEGKSVNTAVTLLIDLSGSMSGRVVTHDEKGNRKPTNLSRKGLAQRAAIALGESLDKCGVAVEILGFSCDGCADSKWHHAIYDYRNSLPNHSADKFDRYEPIDMYVFKAFDESMKAAIPAMGGIEKAGGGNNADGESVLYAVDRLLKRTEKKRILMVLSDGFPAYGKGYNTNVQQHTRDCVEYVKTKGIECIGIGIDSDAVKHFYPKYVVLRDVTELPGVVLDQIAKMILGQRFNIDNSKTLKSSNARARASRAA